MVFTAEETMEIPTTDLLTWMLDAPSYAEDRVIYLDAADERRSLTRAQCRTTVRQIAAGLRALGLQEGDCVLIHAFSDIMYSMLALGIIAAGGVFSGANPSYTPYELTHHVRTADVTIMLAEPELLQTDLAVARDCGIPADRVLCFNFRDPQADTRGCKSWETLFAHGERDWARFDDRARARSTYAMRLFSSGTTGLPKAVQLSHYNLVAQHTLVYEKEVLPYEVRRLLALPHFHVAVAPVAMTSALRAGCLTVVMRRFEPAQFLASIQKHRITTLTMVPPLIIALLAHKDVRKYDLSSVRVGTCGAAPLDKAQQQRFKALLPRDARMTQVWGMTETTCICTLFYFPEDDATGSVGRLAPTIQAKLLDDDGNEVTAYDARGELCVRGPTIVDGYYKNDAANAASFEQPAGWFHTGDIAYCDGKTKKWYLVDRKKDLIKVRGFQVAPVELEAVLLAHPAVSDAAVVGITDPDGAEVPRAYVVLHAGSDSVSEKELKAFSSERLAKYKSLDGGIVFTDAIPRNPSGKILRRELRERAKKEVDDKAGKSKL